MILIAEPESSAVENLRSILASQGWLVKAVETHDQALRAASEFGPQLVLVDEGLSGVGDLLRTFARDSGGTGVVLLSGEADASGVAGSGIADEVVAKPVETDVLIRAVRSLLESAPSKRIATSLSDSGKVLTTEDIFGDLLDDLLDETGEEPEVSSVEEVGPAGLDGPIESDQEVESAPPTVVPEAIEVSETPLDPLADLVSEEDDGPKGLETRLEDTLAAIAASALQGAAAPSTPRTPDRSPEEEVDALLEKTLAGFAALGESVSKTATQASEDPDTEQFLDQLAASEAVDGSLPDGVEAESQEPPLQAMESEEHDIGEGDEGVTFGDYTLEARIGIGGMAEVWKARRRGVEGFEKRVAIKRILPHPATNQAFVEMFIDEAKLAAELNHANITHIYDLGKQGDDYYIAMEFVEGRDLRTVFNVSLSQGRPLPGGLSLFIVSRVAGALDYAHTKHDLDDQAMGIVHRDVSPQNVLIGYDGEIKLCDFGIAKAVSKVSATEVGSLKGKLAFMSPEQAWGRSIDARSDIFSVGSLLFELMTGQPLFSGESEIAILEAVRTCDVEERLDNSDGLSSPVREVLSKALARDPAERFQSAAELAREIEGILSALKPKPDRTDLAAYMQGLFDRSGMPATDEGTADEGTTDEDATQGTGEGVLSDTPPEEDEPDDIPEEPPISALEEQTRPVEPVQDNGLDQEPDDEQIESEVSEKSEGTKRRWILWLIVILLLALASAYAWYASQSDGSQAELGSVRSVEPSPQVLKPRASDPSDEIPATETALASADPGDQAAATSPPISIEPAQDPEELTLDPELDRRFEEEHRRVQELLASSPFSGNQNAASPGSGNNQGTTDPLGLGGGQDEFER